MERLQKIIAESGYTSRRKAEELIKNGKVIVNGKKVTELGTKASFGDEILVEGNLIEYQEKVYYMFNKPRGVVTTTKDDKGRKTVLDFFDDEEKRIYPIGRLDYDTTGLLLLTNDGDFANLMMHPKSKIEKSYIAKIKGILDKEDVRTLKEGIKLDNKIIYPDRVKIKKINKKNNTTLINIVLHDGINHEVKRLIEKLGYEVIKLKRESFGFLMLGSLKSGEKRKLSIKDVKRLISLAKGNYEQHKWIWKRMYYLSKW